MKDWQEEKKRLVDLIEDVEEDEYQEKINNIDSRKVDFLLQNFKNYVGKLDA